jgi:hypothetical protein
MLNLELGIHPWLQNPKGGRSPSNGAEMIASKATILSILSFSHPFRYM